MTLDSRFTIVKTKGTSLWNEHSERCFLVLVRFATQLKSKSKLGSEPQVAQSTALRLQIKLTKSVTYTHGKATLTWFEEIFEEY